MSPAAGDLAGSAEGVVCVVVVKRPGGGWELAFAGGFGHWWRVGWLHCNAQCRRAGQTDSLDEQPGELWLQDLVES